MKDGPGKRVWAAIFLAAAAVLVTIFLPVLYLRRWDSVLSSLDPVQRAQVETGLKEGASVGIIGGADGPTAVFVTKKEKKDE